MSRFDPNNPINYEKMDENLKIIKDRCVPLILIVFFSDSVDNLSLF